MHVCIGMNVILIWKIAYQYINYRFCLMHFKSDIEYTRFCNVMTHVEIYNLFNIFVCFNELIIFSRHLVLFLLEMKNDKIILFFIIL